MQVAGQFAELSPRTLLLSLVLLAYLLPMMRFKQLADLIVLLFHVLEVLLACEEVMLILPRVVAAIAAQIKSKGLTISG